MRRTKLVWFAAGVAVATLSFQTANALFADGDVEGEKFLTVEILNLFDLSDGKESDDIALASGGIFRDCGIERFEIQIGRTDRITYELPVTAVNRTAIDCVLQSMPDYPEQIQLGFEVR